MVSDTTRVAELSNKIRLDDSGSLDELLARTPPLWTGAEFYHFFRLARGTYYYHLNRGEIPHIRVAGQVRIARDVIRALLASQALPVDMTRIDHGAANLRGAAHVSTLPKNYSPYGEGPDGYAIALGHGREDEEDL
jgi:hypothetical protein